MHDFWHYTGNKLLTLLSNMLTHLKLSDMKTGYKVFRRQVAQSMPLESDRFGSSPSAGRKSLGGTGARMKYPDPIPEEPMRKATQGKKITWRDGFTTLWCILRYNLFH